MFQYDENNTLNRFFYGKITLFDVHSKSYVDIRFSSEIQDGGQDGRHNGRQNEANGQYFEMGTYKFAY